MTHRCVLSPAAKDDVDGIGFYSTHKWGEERSDVYLKKIFAKLAIFSNGFYVFVVANIWQFEQETT